MSLAEYGIIQLTVKSWNMAEKSSNLLGFRISVILMFKGELKEK